MKSKPRKCSSPPTYSRMSNIKRNIRKVSIQARMSNEIHLIIIRGEKPVGKYSDNHFFPSHMYLVLEFLSGRVYAVTMSAWQPLIPWRLRSQWVGEVGTALGVSREPPPPHSAEDTAVGGVDAQPAPVCSSLAFWCVSAAPESYPAAL